MIDRQWATIAVQACVSAGVDHFFLAPGSRCTPLTLAIAEHPGAHVVQHFDERGLSFAALGYARGSDRPGVFVCTSGTAVANAYPAVIEASMERIPMLLWTADRPPELRGTGANQTIDQLRIFGHYARWFFDMPCPTEALPHKFVQSTVARALSESRFGPIQLNWMFREPFGVDDAPIPLDIGTLQPEVFQEPTGAAAGDSSAVPTEIPLTGDTIVVAGDCRPQEACAIRDLASEYELPLVTDITSGLRGTPPDRACLLSPPETIVHFGGRIVSKTWHTWSATRTNTTNSEARYIHVTPRGILINPHQRPQERHELPIQRVRFRRDQPNSAEFNRTWREASTSYWDVVRIYFAELQGDSGAWLTEPEIAHLVGKTIPQGHGLFLGNSTPIRDFDRYACWPKGQDIVVGANRGASGIDGLLATSIGFARGLERPTTVVLGDLSTLHDLNSLALLGTTTQPVTLVVINNRAGGIFDMLPVSRCTAHFEQYFATPHTLDFASAASMFGLRYDCLRSSEEGGTDKFRALYENAVSSGHSGVLEVQTNRVKNQRLRERIQERLRS